MERLRILVGVYVVRGPMGGLSWHYLHYALALAELGHHVTVIEDSGDHEWGCYNPLLGTNDTDARFGLRYAEDAYRRLGLADAWAYFDAHGAGWCGPASRGIDTLLANADVFLNISGATVMRPWLREVPHRVFIDTDPAFTQVRHLTLDADRQLAEEHSHFFTFGERVGEPDCRIPDDGFPWQPTRQPIALSRWPVQPLSATDRLTTVMRWDSYATRSYGDVELGMKSRSFQPVADLPRHTRAELEIALGGPCPTRELNQQGWRIRDPFEAAPDPFAMQRYLAGSTGEFSVAKHGYVTTRSGWFSERSANYLASGRAVITEDTGFSAQLPTGDGLLAFTDRESALAAIDSVLSQPQAHGARAREIAHECFDGGTVMSYLLARVMKGNAS